MLGHTITQQMFAIKYEISFESRSRHGQWQPMWVILPHLAVGNLRGFCPHRLCLISFHQITRAAACDKDRYMKFVAIRELKEKLSHILQAHGGHANFLLCLSDSCLKRRFTFLQSPARSVYLACPQPALLSNQQNLLVPHDEAEIRILGWPPIHPINLIHMKVHKVHGYSRTTSITMSFHAQKAWERLRRGPLRAWELPPR